MSTQSPHQGVSYSSLLALSKEYGQEQQDRNLETAPEISPYGFVVVQCNTFQKRLACKQAACIWNEVAKECISDSTMCSLYNSEVISNDMETVCDENPLCYEIQDDPNDPFSIRCEARSKLCYSITTRQCCDLQKSNDTSSCAGGTYYEDVAKVPGILGYTSGNNRKCVWYDGFCEPTWIVDGVGSNRRLESEEYQYAGFARSMASEGSEIFMHIGTAILGGFFVYVLMH